MTDGSYQFNIGDITCIAIEEGSAPRTHENICGCYTNIPDEEVTAGLQIFGDDPDLTNYFNLLYIDTGTKQILVDTGMGEGSGAGVGKTIPALKAAGVNPDEIDIVFITHFHGDHINGLLDDAGQPVLPAAHYVTPQSEWNYWMSEDTIAELGEERTRGYVTMMNAIEDRMSFVSDGDLLAPGVTVVEIPGHTMGHAGLMVESEGERLFFVVDLLHHEIQFAHPDWEHKFDVDKPLAARSRKKALQQAADEGMLTMFYHLQFPGLGYVRRSDDAYQWQPLDS